MDSQVILLADDDEDTIAVFGTMLRHFGYRVLVARDGLACVELAMAERPRLILMDLWMPGLDGWEATRRLRSTEKTASAVILALTAHAHDDARERARSGGFDGFLTKPIQPAQLVEEVRRRIGSPFAHAQQ